MEDLTKIKGCANKTLEIVDSIGRNPDKFINRANELGKACDMPDSFVKDIKSDFNEISKINKSLEDNENKTFSERIDIFTDLNKQIVKTKINVLRTAIISLS